MTMKSHFHTLIVLWILTFSYNARTLGACSHTRETKKSHGVSHLFVLGDSGLDAGTNNYIPNCKSRANFPPYGMTYFHHPTGRFSDGRTLADFIAKKLGLPFPQSFLDKKANFSKGINFASGGSGILDQTGSTMKNAASLASVGKRCMFGVFSMKTLDIGRSVPELRKTSSVVMKVVPMRVQVNQFSQAIIRRSQTEISKSIVLIQVGSNDFKEYFLNETMMNTISLQQFIHLLLFKYKSYLIKLHNLGVGKIVISDISPLGCFPASLITKNTTDKACLETVNIVSQAFNEDLFKQVSTLNLQLKAKSKSKGGVVVAMKTYTFFMDVLKNPKKFGFKETSNACCGGGAYNAVLDCDKRAKVCKNPRKFIFWDRYHQTDRFHSLLSKVMWSGNSSYIFPFNVKKLAYDGFLANV